MRNSHETVDRVKQFAPFDALRGFREALAEKERVLVPRMELTDERVEQIERKLHFVRPNEIITVTYFHQDAYLRVSGMVASLNADEQTLTVVKTKIRFSDILDLWGGSIPDEAEPI